MACTSCPFQDTRNIYCTQCGDLLTPAHIVCSKCGYSYRPDGQRYNYCPECGTEFKEEKDR
jgi:predicted amidophosphoribosyltransferase